MNAGSLYPILKSVHIFCMITGFSLLVLGELLLIGGAYLRSAPRLFHWSRRTGTISFLLRAVGVFAGIGTAITGGWSLVAPWLLLAYVLIGITFILEGLFIKPWEQRLQAATAHPETVTAMQQILRERRAVLARGLVLLVFVGIFLTMRLKPSFGTANSVQAAVPTSSAQADVVYTLTTTMGGMPGLAFAGVGGEIEGMVNPTLTAVVGDTITITLINGYAMPHDLTIEGLSLAAEQLSDAGQQSTIRFTLAQAGDYIYFCSVPGHREAGMWGILRVSPDGTRQ
jgi:plastocyanin